METPQLRAACAAEADRYELALEQLERLGGDMLSAFVAAADAGRIEPITSSATHAILPLLATRGGRRMQVETGIRSHRRRFGPVRGFWLPECAYQPGIEHLLAEAGIDYFCVDQSSHEPAGAALRPIAARGLTAFPIDWEAIEWLWSLQGYPSDPLYADFHRKSLRGTRPWAISGQAYDPAAAAARAREHADQFARAVSDRLADHRDATGDHGLLTFSVDTELLGHWWWEGPIWLEAVLRALPANGVRAVKLGQAQLAHPPERRPLVRSSWGESKDLRTWDSPRVADLAWGNRKLELRLQRELDTGRIDRPGIERAARELMAAQASDWAFLDYRRQAGDYAYQRALGHAENMFEAIDCNGRAEPRLRDLAPDLTITPLLEP
jgi:1,4-alpha-glucan branching enzyme